MHASTGRSFLLKAHMLMLDEHVLLPNGLVLQAIVPEEHPNSLVLKSIATYLSARVDILIID